MKNNVGSLVCQTQNLNLVQFANVADKKGSAKSLDMRSSRPMDIGDKDNFTPGQTVSEYTERKPKTLH